MKAYFNSVFSVGGLSIQSLIERTADGQFAHEIPTVAAATGSLTTRTDDNTGVVTAAAGHGLLTGDKIIVCWAGGCRYGMDATVSGNAVTLDGGGGDNLPAQDTAVYLAKEIVVTRAFDADDLAGLAVGASTRAVVVFCSAATTYELALDLDASEGYAWIADGPTANPLVGDDIIEIHVAAGINTAGTVKIGGLLDTTP